MVALVGIITFGLLYNASRPYRILDRSEGPGGVFLRIGVPPGTSKTQIQTWCEAVDKDYRVDGKSMLINVYYGEHSVNNLVGQYSEGQFLASRPDVPP